MRRPILYAGAALNLALCASITSASETVTYSYDELGRLIGATSSGGPVSGEATTIDYDPAGNRTTYVIGTGAPGAVSFSIGNASASEGNIATFTVTKAGTATGTLTVNWATATGSASSSDFSMGTGQLSFGANETSKTISIQTTEDSTAESAETFTVTLSSPSGGATISSGTGTGTIQDDDSTPGISFSVDNVSVTEAGTLTFTVSKNGSGAADVTYATANGTATAASDYAAVGPTVLSFTSAQTSKTVSVVTAGDTLVEGNETLYLNLSNATNGATISDAQGLGTIVDDDTTPPPPSFSVADAPAVSEGGQLVYQITATNLTSGSYNVYFQTADGTATAGSDYQQDISVRTLTPTSATADIVVQTIEENVVESSETVLVNLTSVSNGGTIADGQAIGTINDDDVAGNTPPVAVDDSVSINRCETIFYTLGTNDSDPDGDIPLTVTQVVLTNGYNDGYVLIDTGTRVEIKGSSFAGTTTYTYTLQDSRGGTDTATLSVTTQGICNDI